MITRNEILETNSMISDMNLDVRTITMGISLLDCADADINKFNEKVYKKITTYAKDLVKVGDELAKEYGVPVVNKRIFRNTHRDCGGRLQKCGFLCEHCSDTGQGSAGGWRKLHRRLFRAGAEGLYRK